MAKRHAPPSSSNYYQRSRPPKRVPRFADLPDWLTWAEAQQYLRLGPEAFAARLKSGDIPSRRFGRQYRIPKDALKPGGAR